MDKWGWPLTTVSKLCAYKGRHTALLSASFITKVRRSEGQRVKVRFKVKHSRKVISQKRCLYLFSSSLKDRVGRSRQDSPWAH